MNQFVEAVYEDGVLKPLSPLTLKNHQRVRIIITPAETAAVQSRGIVKAPPEVVEELALSDAILSD